MSASAIVALAAFCALGGFIGGMGWGYAVGLRHYVDSALKGPHGSDA